LKKGLQWGRGRQASEILRETRVVGPEKRCVKEGMWKEAKVLVVRGLAKLKEGREKIFTEGERK